MQERCDTLLFILVVSLLGIRDTESESQGRKAVSVALAIQRGDSILPGRNREWHTLPLGETARMMKLLLYEAEWKPLRSERSERTLVK